MNQRRVRVNRHMRELTATVQLSYKEFIQPLFVDESVSARTAIATLNEVNSDTIDGLLEQIERDIECGITKFLLFPVPVAKSENDFDFSFAVSAVEKIKKQFGESVWIAADVCLCAYTTHGHCGILNAERNAILNNESVDMLAAYALQLASAGADCIAPSDMMDGRIGAIRKKLDDNHLSHVSIMSYSAKFCSQFYGPFRDACKSAPGKSCNLNDRKTYQLSPFNKNDALATVSRDMDEGADIIMVKPALPYLDIIHELKQTIRHPIAAYHVSGEYQSIELLAAAQLTDRARAHTEIWTALKRGGAGMIISYAARHARKWIEQIQY